MARLGLFGGGDSNQNNQSNAEFNEKTLPVRPKERSSSPAQPHTISIEPVVRIHALPSLDGVIVKIEPPRQPANSQLEHVPCDIVLVIDISGSMAAEALVPTQPGETPERNGLSVLDLTRHAARTIMETLNENDRLGIVTFAHAAQCVQKLTPMTASNKHKTSKKLDHLKPQGITNLWGGIVEGLKLFDRAAGSPDGKVPALMVLTDGVPNHMCPPHGYVHKLRQMQLKPTVHTFGFGYTLRSGLLKSIAEVGGGNYSFIPDAGMIGTVFVHAVANLQSTFANNAVLRLTYPKYLKLQETTGESVDKQEPVQPDDPFEQDQPDATMQLSIVLNNLQYGQSRDIYLRYDSAVQDAVEYSFDIDVSPVVTATLEYRHFTDAVHSTPAVSQDVLLPTATLPPAEIAYHVSRSAIVSFLATLAPLRVDGEHQPVAVLDESMADFKQPLQQLIASLPANRPEFASDAACRSLLDDLCGADPRGQVSLALSRADFYYRWGKHYLQSLAGAHARQVCNSFKDAGPLMYGARSPLFVACRDRLDAAFDSLPAPRPSNLPPADSYGYGGVRNHESFAISMQCYNRFDNPCFAGSCKVLLAPPASVRGNAVAQKSSGMEGGAAGPEPLLNIARLGAGKKVPVSQLRRGMRVQTPRGARRVRAVLRTPVAGAAMCVVGSSEGGEQLLVTPWHPVYYAGGWRFPRDVQTTRAAALPVRFTGSVYSVLLERDSDPDAHAILVGGVWAVTLGHGITTAAPAGDDVRAHAFLGSYTRVEKGLAGLRRSSGGRVLGETASDFRKDWQRRVRCHFDQPGKKVTRRIARRAKAAAVAPRPVDSLRPIVRCPTVKYNRRTRLGRGFSIAELKAAGIPKLYAPTIGIKVDHRRANLSEEGLAANVERLKAYKARLIVFPRKTNKPKKTDTPKDKQTGETTQSIRSAFGVVDAITAGFSEIKKSDLPKNVEGGAYKALRKARSDARYVGVREKRAKDKAEAEKDKK
ncbi:ribosomal protein L13e-domain-containing protein [Lasiosphaeria ovina]|uniref:Ribosomal protein L13e-domain-containing protein n=1 Tax=Lasiosphaeria ovina TaxID=92902 RepID=A0AAE0N9M3_9PEZI|nr:ribosomal protein L13e-domain-containing protein [Lasiosphaeria ovina]